MPIDMTEERLAEIEFAMDELCTALREARRERDEAKENDRRYRWLYPRLSCMETRLNEDGSISYRFHLAPGVLDSESTWYASLDLAIDECSGFSGVGTND